MLFIRSGQNPVSLCAKAEIQLNRMETAMFVNDQTLKYTDFSHCYRIYAKQIYQ